MSLLLLVGVIIMHTTTLLMVDNLPDDGNNSYTDNDANDNPCRETSKSYWNI